MQMWLKQLLEEMEIKFSSKDTKKEIEFSCHFLFSVSIYLKKNFLYLQLNFLTFTFDFPII